MLNVVIARDIFCVQGCW